jgi:hypothetical protein
MASLILDFVPPPTTEWTTLEVWEAATKETAPGTLAQSFPVSPPYPTRIVVTTANSPTGWFSIRWGGAGGLFTPFSDPIQGGTDTLVGKLINRVMLRQPNSDENIVLQVTEAVVSEYFGTQDIYSIDPETVSYKVMEGLTLMIMAYTLISEMGQSASSSSGTGWTAGLVSMKASTDSTVKSSWDSIDRLLARAQALLGVGFSRIAQMEIEIAGGLSQIVTADISRLLIEVE